MSYTPYTWPSGSTIRSTDLQHAETQYGQLTSDYLYQYSSGATTLLSASSVVSYNPGPTSQFEKTIWYFDVPANVLPSTFDIAFSVACSCSTMGGHVAVRRGEPFDYVLGSNSVNCGFRLTSASNALKYITFVTTSANAYLTFSTTISIPTPGRYCVNYSLDYGLGGAGYIYGKDFSLKGARVATASTAIGMTVGYVST
jgi:hypothetical protein